MSKFFDSETVKSEMEEITCLQKELYDVILKFPMMSPKAKVEHIDTVLELLERQQIMWTRLSLTDDKEAKKMKDKVLDSAKDLGLPANIDMNIFFKNMNEMVEVMRREIDNKDSLS